MKALSDPMEARQSEEAQRGALNPFNLNIAVMGYAVLYSTVFLLSQLFCLTSPLSPLLSSHLSCPLTSPVLSPLLSSHLSCPLTQIGRAHV